MDEHRLPKILFLSQLDDGKGLLIGGQERTFKRAVIVDIETFGLVRQRTGEKVTAFEKRRAEFILELTQNRKLWRNAVKVQGVDIAMEEWYATKAALSDRRHSDESNHTTVLPFKYTQCKRESTSATVSLQPTVPQTCAFAQIRLDNMASNCPQ
jgi:hypothetical protein